MKAIILGYASEDGKGKATIVASPEVPIAEQRQLIQKIKSTREYPAGCKRVDYCELEVREVGILIASTTETEKPKAKKQK